MSPLETPLETRTDSTVITYTYDYLGRRKSKKVGTGTATHYVYDGWNLIAKYAGTAFAMSYTWGMDLSGSMQGAGGVGGLLAANDGTSTYYPTFDGNGNVSEYLDGTGAVVGHYEYDAFGNTTTSSGSKAGDFDHRFSTKYFDGETGLYYYGYRYYDPETGRWPSRDPIGERGGLNLYGMVGNDGVNWVDVLGMWFDFGDNESEELFDRLWQCAQEAASTEFFILLSELRDSEHRISILKRPEFPTATRIPPEEGAHNGQGADVWIHWKTENGYCGWSMCSVMFHELKHAQHTVNGTVPRDDPRTGQKPDNDGNGFPDFEDESSDIGNRYREDAGEALRDGYGDNHPDPSRTDFDEDAEFDPDAHYHPRNQPGFDERRERRRRSNAHAGDLIDGVPYNDIPRATPIRR